MSAQVRFGAAREGNVPLYEVRVAGRAEREERGVQRQGAEPARVFDPHEERARERS